MADDNTIILKLQLEEAQSKVKIKKLNQDLDKLDGRTKEYRESVAKLNLEEQKLINTRKKLSQTTSELIGDNKKGLNGVSKASGSATAAAMELGRVVSDAPYGIRGMANNVSQLASQLFFMAGQQVTATTATKASTAATNSDTTAKVANTTATVGATAATTAATGATVGFFGAVKMMWSALMGPMGFLLALQAVISAVDYFYGANTKAEESIKSLNDANIEGAKTAGKTATEFKILTDIVLDKTSKDKDQAKALKILNKRYEDFNTDLITNAKNLKEAREEVDKYTESLIVQAKAQAALDLIKEKQSKVFLLEEETAFAIREEGFESVKELNIQIEKERERMSSGSNRGVKAAAALRFKNLTNLRDANKDEIKELNEQINRLSSLEEIRKSVLSGGPKDKDGAKLIDPKSFEADLFEVEKMLRGFRYNDLKESAKTEQQKAAAKSLIELDKFKQNYYEYVNSEAKKFDKFKENLDKQLKAKKISEDSYNSALSTAEEERRKGQKSSYENFLIGLKAISDKYSPDIIGEGITVTTTLAEQAKKDAKIKLDGQLDAFLEYAKSAKIALTAISSFLQAESDRELTIEQNKTNALNAELNQRLLNENLSKDERASIQNQIAVNDERLRKKQNEIKKKAFKTQKAFNISIAIADTVVAGIRAAKESPGGSVAKIAAMTATIGAGLAQVAIIARQKFQPDAANTPINVGSSSGGGSARAEPSFNIVGRSNDNLIMSAIQSQFDQPLRAYVVARDVTNQQQLDGVISSSAST